jgi:hypothetical protein
MPPDVVCRITQSQPPLRTRASHRFYHNLNLSPQRTSPPGSAGVAPACRVHRHCARIQRYTPSPLHRLGARASSPHAGCTGIAPAYSDALPHPCTAWGRGLPARIRRSSGCAGFQPAYGDTPHHPCTVWVRERRARMPEGAGVAPASSPLGARASRPHAGYASVSLACRVRGRFARMQRCALSEGGTPSSRGACVPPGVNSYTTLYYCFTAGIVLYCDPILGGRMPTVVRTTMSEPANPRQRAAQLIDEGIAAIRAGDQMRARQLLSQAVQLDPQNERGWLWLSGALPDAAQRRYCLERVLAINPQNEVAKRGLASLTSAAPPAAPSASASKPTTPPRSQPVFDPLAPDVTAKRDRPTSAPRQLHPLLRRLPPRRDHLLRQPAAPQPEPQSRQKAPDAPPAQSPFPTALPLQRQSRQNHGNACQNRPLQHHPSIRWHRCVPVQAQNAARCCVVPAYPARASPVQRRQMQRPFSRRNARAHCSSPFSVCLSSLRS